MFYALYLKVTALIVDNIKPLRTNGKLRDDDTDFFFQHILKHTKSCIVCDPQLCNLFFSTLEHVTMWVQACVFSTMIHFAEKYTYQHDIW